jgi:hypothetical protein
MYGYPIGNCIPPGKGMPGYPGKAMPPNMLGGVCPGAAPPPGVVNTADVAVAGVDVAGVADEAEE